MPRLENILYGIASLLLVPCLALLIGLLAATLFGLGGLVREALQRRSGARAVAGLVAGANAAEDGGLSRPWRRLILVVGRSGVTPIEVEECLAAAEAGMSRRIDRLGLAAKIGPMLGLAGTLIPLGPALRAMGAGDAGVLAKNLVVAFAATVVGLAIGGPSLAMATVRKRWYEQDLTDMDLYARRRLSAAAEPRR